MDRTKTSPDVVTALTPFLSEPRPIEAAERAGVKLPRRLVERAAERNGGKAFPTALAESLAAHYGPVPPVRVSIGPRAPVTLVESGYKAVASTDLSVLNDILTELWRVGTIPHQLSESLSSSFLHFDELAANCNNVPAGGTLGLLELSSPPRASASSVTNANLHLDLSFRVPVLVDGQEAAALSGVLGLEVPLDFEVTADSFVQPSLTAIDGVTGTLTIDASSSITPSSEAARQALENLIVPRSRTALLYLSGSTLRFKASIPVSKSRYPNSFIDVVQAGAVTLREGGRDFAIVGLNVENTHSVDQLALTTVPFPGPDLNLHAILGEEFASDALSSIITSGDLAAFINRVLARHSPVNLAPVVVNGGRIDFQAGQLVTSIDCTMVDACEFGKDLSFTATVKGTPSVANGTLTIDNSDVDIDLDNVDAFLCTILNSVLGPFGTVITIAVLAFAAAYNPSASDLDIPVSETSEPLPGSDKVVHLELTQATMTPGVLTADGRLGLVSDPEHVFAYLRVVEKMGPMVTFPVAGATVDLYELDNPAPPGDDVAVPETGEKDTFTQKYLTETVIQYDPLPDELLGTQTTDEDGNVTFVVTSNEIGGMETKTTTKTEIQTDHVVSFHTQHIPIPEPGPDLGVTITWPSGQVVAQRRLVGLNVTSRRLGTFDHRIEVVVSPPHLNVHPSLDI